MELWIRSQDKRTLLKVNRIDVDGKKIIVWDNDYYCSETYMGTYATEERALEVLDEIQKILKSSFIVNGLGEYVSQSNTTIYEMPKE